MNKNKEDWNTIHKQLNFHLVSIKTQMRSLREDGRVDGKEPTLNPAISGPLRAYVKFVLILCIPIEANP
jgi:hypothetical protein